MKIIISHDVDHLFLSEHYKDTFIPGLLKRSVVEHRKKRTRLGELSKRFAWRLNNIQELHAFNSKYSIPATWFFGMRTGLNLSYHWKKAKTWVHFLRDQGASVGLHGMSYDNKALLLQEKNRLEEVLGSPVNGIRNHYLRMSDSTLAIMNELGFAYDSTEKNTSHPRKIGELTEIPIGLMDVDLLQVSADPTCWPNHSLGMIEKAKRLHVPFFVINFHDVYYSDGWPNFKAWYQTLIKKLYERNFSFVNFDIALRELAQ